MTNPRDAFYNTPNVFVPLNNREKGEIADVAKDQLIAWQIIAEEWPIAIEGRFNRCHVCGQNIWYTADATGDVYDYNDAEISALIVGHIRQNHSEAIDGGTRGQSEILYPSSVASSSDGGTSDSHRSFDKGVDSTGIIFFEESD